MAYGYRQGNQISVVFEGGRESVSHSLFKWEERNRKHKREKKGWPGGAKQGKSKIGTRREKEGSRMVRSVQHKG